LIKLLIKLAIVALVANAAWHTMSAYASYYKFKDAVQQTTQFGNDKSLEQLKVRILELAGSYDLPVMDEDLKIRRESLHTIVDCEYSKTIELFPWYSRDWRFSMHTDTFSEAPMTGGR
jgi:hypothetical protein